MTTSCIPSSSLVFFGSPAFTATHGRSFDYPCMIHPKYQDNSRRSRICFVVSSSSFVLENDAQDWYLCSHTLHGICVTVSSAAKEYVSESRIRPQKMTTNVFISRKGSEIYVTPLIRPLPIISMFHFTTVLQC